MDSRKRLFIAFSITMILIVALFTSFGRNLFASETPQVTLPVVNSNMEEVSEELPDSGLQRVEITSNTVQGVIAALNPSDNYYRSVETTLFWGASPEESLLTSVEIWTDQGISHIKKTLPSSAVRHDILHDNLVYYWYEGNEEYLTMAQEEYTMDFAQWIPSYQTVLALDTSSIQWASYELRNGIPAIYVQASPEPLYFTEHYWIHAQTGVLLAAETYDQEQLIYRMEGYGTISPYENPSFLLPDGTALTLTEEEEE